MHRLMCAEPAKLCGLDHIKGKIAQGYDADFTIWDPTAEFIVTTDLVQFKNKANPYIGKKLTGRVHATFVRGHCVYAAGQINPPIGNLLQSKRSH